MSSDRPPIANAAEALRAINELANEIHRRALLVSNPGGKPNGEGRDLQQISDELRRLLRAHGHEPRS